MIGLLDSSIRSEYFVPGIKKTKLSKNDEKSKTTERLTQRDIFKTNFGWPDQPSSGLDVTNL